MLTGRGSKECQTCWPRGGLLCLTPGMVPHGGQRGDSERALGQAVLGCLDMGVGLQIRGDHWHWPLADHGSLPRVVTHKDTTSAREEGCFPLLSDTLLLGQDGPAGGDPVKEGSGSNPDPQQASALPLCGPQSPHLYGEGLI